MSEDCKLQLINKNKQIDALQDELHKLRSLLLFVYNRSMTARVEAYSSKRHFNQTSDHNIKFIAELAGFGLGTQPDFGALKLEKFDIDKMIEREKWLK